jgi:hypothetical protein
MSPPMDHNGHSFSPEIRVGHTLSSRCDASAAAIGARGDDNALTTTNPNK